MTTDDVGGSTIIKFGISGVDTHEVELTFNQDEPTLTNDIVISDIEIKACYSIGEYE